MTIDHISFFCSSRNVALPLYGEIVLPLLTLLFEYGTRTIHYGGGDNGLMGVLYDKGTSLGMNVVGHNLKKWASPNLPNEFYYDNLVDRQYALVSSGQYYIILPGGIGTLYELTQVLCHNDVERRNKPVILYNPNHYFDGFLQLLEHSIRQGLTDLDRLHFHVIDSIHNFRQLLDNLSTIKSKL
jgi:uncharacterized protein (TIGR00730 family)